MARQVIVRSTFEMLPLREFIIMANQGFVYVRVKQNGELYNPKNYILYRAKEVAEGDHIIGWNVYKRSLGGEK